MSCHSNRSQNPWRNSSFPSTWPLNATFKPTFLYLKFITQHKYITFKKRIVNLWQHAHSSPTIHQEILDWFSCISIHPRKTKQTSKTKKHKQMLSVIETKFTITMFSPITCKKLNTNKMHNKKDTMTSHLHNHQLLKVCHFLIFNSCGFISFIQIWLRPQP
jgi:hypothetical protein